MCEGGAKGEGAREREGGWGREGGWIDQKSCSVFLFFFLEWFLRSAVELQKTNERGGNKPRKRFPALFVFYPTFYVNLWMKAAEEEEEAQVKCTLLPVHWSPALMRKKKTRFPSQIEALSSGRLLCCTGESCKLSYFKKINQKLRLHSFPLQTFWRWCHRPVFWLLLRWSSRIESGKSGAGSCERVPLSFCFHFPPSSDLDRAAVSPAQQPWPSSLRATWNPAHRRVFITPSPSRCFASRGTSFRPLRTSSDTNSHACACTPRSFNPNLCKDIFSRIIYAQTAWKKPFAGCRKVFTSGNGA